MDQLNVAANERIDLADFQFATSTLPTGLVNEVTASLFVNNGANWVVSGFASSIISTPLGVQVGDNVTPNIGLLGQRSGGVISADVLCATGTASQTVALTSFAAGTYGLFVRFARNPGAAAQRVYWDGNNAREYTQLTNTKNIAQFEVRVESVAPSAEWLQIATIVISGSAGATTATITDQRPMYFEGTSSGGYAPTWGTTQDRTSTRLSKPITDLRTMIDALKQAILDIKGPSIAGWYTRNVQGLNVGAGFAGANPTVNRIAVGDLSFYLDRAPLISSPGDFSYTFNLGPNSTILGDSISATTGGGALVLLTANQMQFYAKSFLLVNTSPGGGGNRIYPEAQVFAAGAIFRDGTRRTVGATVVSSPPPVNGVYTITFSTSVPASAFVLTQPVSNDASAVGFSSFGVIDFPGRLVVRMSRGSATVSTTPSDFYFAIIYGS